jgi:hypothetical protein
MLLSILLTGCSTLGSKDAAAGCQVADVAGVRVFITALGRGEQCPCSERKTLMA